MRPWLVYSLSLAVTLAACRVQDATCGHPDLERIDGNCTCRNRGRYICDTPDECYCEDPATRADASTPADAGMGSDAMTPAPDAQVTCGADTTRCGDECFDTRVDSEHCGACDSPCEAPNQCNVGRCIDPVIDVESGWWHTCALRASGSVWCWGSNTFGQLGDGTTIERHAPVQVVGIDDAIAIAVGGMFDRWTSGAGTCALRATGEVSCWGSFVNRASTPVPMAGLRDVTDLSAGGLHACAVLPGGTVMCWGRNGGGQLGDVALEASWEPVVVSGVTDATAISLGVGHSCAVLRDGGVVCWGVGTSGELGDGRAMSSSTPVGVRDLVNIDAVVAGPSCTCSRSASGEVRCWGSNALGCIGTEAVTDYASRPRQITTPRDFRDVFETTTGAVCGRRATGTVLCWGADPPHESSPSPSISYNAVPTERSDLTEAVDISTSYFTECAVWRDGTVSCRGNNVYGQIGDGTTETREDFVRVLP